MKRSWFSSLFLGSVLMLGTASPLMTQQLPLAEQQLQGVHSPRSIDAELDHLTQALQLTPAEQKAIRPLLVEHHDRIQSLFERNPAMDRATLAPQIHAISDRTHREIEALLTDHQKQLAHAMQARQRTADGLPPA